MIRASLILGLLLIGAAAGTIALITYRPALRAERFIRTENGWWGAFVVQPCDPSIEHMDSSEGILHASYTTEAESTEQFWEAVEHQTSATMWFPVLEHQGIRIYHRTEPALDSYGAPWERLVIHLEPKSRRVRFHHWRETEFALVYCVQQRCLGRPWPLWDVLAGFGDCLRNTPGVALAPIRRDTPPVETREDLKNLFSEWLASSLPKDRRKERLAPQGTWTIESGPDSDTASLLDRSANVLEVWHDNGDAAVLHLVCKNPATGGTTERTIPIRSAKRTGIVCPWPWIIQKAVLRPERTGGVSQGRHAHARVPE